MPDIRTCTHIKDDGQPCQAIPVHNSPYCYFHRKYYNPPALPGDANYVTPLLESHQSIQLAVTHLYQSFLSKKIDLKQANFGLQILRLASKTITAIEKQKKEEGKRESDGRRSPSTGQVKMSEQAPSPGVPSTGSVMGWSPVQAERSSATISPTSTLTAADPRERDCASRALDLAQKARAAAEPKRGIYDPYGCMPKNAKETTTR